MDHDFANGVKSILVWQNWGLRVYFQIYTNKNITWNLYWAKIWSSNKVRVRTLGLVLWLEKVLKWKQVLFGKSVIYKWKFTLKTIFCLNITPITKLGLQFKFGSISSFCSIELKSSFLYLDHWDFFVLNMAAKLTNYFF